MQDNAAKNLATAEAANMKAKMLAPTQPEKEDQNIAQAMAQVTGKLPAPQQPRGPDAGAAAEADPRHRHRADQRPAVERVRADPTRAWHVWDRPRNSRHRRAL